MLTAIWRRVRTAFECVAETRFTSALHDPTLTHALRLLDTSGLAAPGLSAAQREHALRSQLAADHLPSLAWMDSGIWGSAVHSAAAHDALRILAVAVAGDE